MTSGTTELLDRLRRLDVEVRAEGEALRLNAPRGALTPELRDELARNKQEILAWLRRLEPHVAPLLPVPRTGELPLSFTQQSLWFLDQLEPGNPFYNIFDAVDVEGPLDVAAMQRSLQEVARRHETLRTTFPCQEGRPLQRIHPALDLPLPMVDLSSLAAEKRAAETDRVSLEEARQPFDLASGPLVRVLLLRLGPAEHRQLLTLHHVIADAWSMVVLVREVMALYAAFRDGRRSPLDELPIQYADHAAWQHRRLQGGMLEEQLSYWRERLADVPTLIELPTDRPRPPAQTFRGAVHPLEIPKALGDALKRLSQERKVTLFVTLLGAFAGLLHRYTGRERILIGSPIAGRNQTEAERLIGLFINLLVLRTDLPGDPAFAGILDGIRNEVAGAHAHQDLPFERLVEELHPERTLSHNPLFQVMLVMRNVPRTEMVLSGLRLRPIQLDVKTTKCDLSLILSEGPGGLDGELEYSTDLFDGPTVARMAGHLRCLLEGGAADPRRRLSELPLLTEPERHQLLAEWNDTAGSPEAELTMHRWIEEVAAARPGAAAAACGEDRLTYGELNRRANRLAHRLLDLGVRPGMPVAICAERSLDMLVGLLGILKSGGAYVPLDPGYPRERLAFMLCDLDARVLVTPPGLASRLPESDARVVRLGGPELEACSDENPESGVTADDLAYLIYTSGSTGTPKGVMVSHRNLVASARARQVYYREPVGSFLLLPSFAFDSSVAVLFWTLGDGGMLVLPEEGVQQDLLRLTELLVRHRVTHLLCLPSIYALLLERSAAEPLPDLRAVVVAGEACPRELGELHARLRPHGLLFNEYGPTEGTVWCTVHRLEGHEPRPHVAIGGPIQDAQVYVLDARLQPLPQGVPGELFLGGAGLTRGYLSRPALTAERFLPSPFASRDGERLYRTGDLVRQRPDGAIEFLGRIDQQVKIRGFRIELSEIEEALHQHPAVRQAVVAALGDRPGAAPPQRLVAYLVAAWESAPTPAELRAFLHDRLPPYMVPSAFVTLLSMPLTPNGKVDRNALPWPEREPEDGSAAAPRTAAERRLAEIWAQVLRARDVGIHDNFFELGGDSILSIQVVAKANEAGLRLTPKQLFEHQTIAELSEVLGQEAVQADQGPVTGPAPLTPIQRWFFEQSFSEPHHWNQTVLLELPAGAAPGLLATVLERVLEHHDALRLRFRRGPDGWHQAFAEPGGPVPFIRVDLSAVPVGARAQAVDFLQASLDLERGPLARAAFLDLGAGEPPRLLLVFHHLAVDGVSWRILLEDLGSAYLQLSRGQEARLPARTTSFQVWGEKLLEQARSAAVRAELPYWLARTAPARLPLDAQAPPEANTVGAARTLTLSFGKEETRVLLRDAPAAYRAQANEILLAALVEALGPLTLDIEAHGREPMASEVDLSRTVGWFTAIYPLTFERGASAAETLKSVKERLRQVPGRGIGYGLLRYLGDAETAAALAALPRPEVLFNYLGQFDSGTAEGLFRPSTDSAGASRSPAGRRDHLLEVNGAVMDGELRLDLTYSPVCHREETVQALAQAFRRALSDLLDASGEPKAAGYTPSDFPLARLDQATVDRLFGGDPQVEDVYPLSPLQKGLLFHTVYDSDSGEYVVQMSCTFEGDLDTAALGQAWQHVVDAHPILRTAILWEGLDEPLQVVRRGLTLPQSQEDWRNLSPERQQERLRELLVQDRREGFQLSRAPLMRTQLIRLAEDRHQFLWTFHHLLLDGWSLPLLLGELFAAYEALLGGRPAPASVGRPYRGYIEWLQQQDESAAEAYWRRTLRGFREPTPLVLEGDRKEGDEDYAEQHLFLDEQATAAIEAFVRRHRLTLGTLLEGAWALQLSHLSRREDVVFGLAVAGRPPGLKGSESIVGLFLNTVALRVCVEPQRELLPWLREIQAQLGELRQYELSGLAQVQEWSELPPRRQLFDSFLNVLNYPIDQAMRRMDVPLQVTDARWYEKANFPLSLVVTPGPRLQLECKHYLERCGRRRQTGSWRPSRPCSRASPGTPSRSCSNGST
nr:condensation domain-containing protein [uncultured bacterium]